MKTTTRMINVMAIIPSARLIKVQLIRHIQLYRKKALLFLLVFLSGCDGDQEATNVTYHVPDGYQGFALVKFTGPTEGKEKDLNITISLSPKGETIVSKDFDLDNKWTKVEARYKSGKSISTIFTGVPDGQIGFWTLGSSSGGILLLIGKEQTKDIHYRDECNTLEDYNKRYKELFGEDKL